jgi:Dual specificity phosphatase, catalytic domain
MTSPHVTTATTTCRTSVSGGGRHDLQHHHMGEVRPGLWIGDLHSITQLLDTRISCTHHSTRWTIITILNSSKLLRLVRTIVLRYRNSSPNCEIVRHIEWILPDSIQTNFLSPQLVNIVEMIQQALHSPHPDEEQLQLVGTTTTTRNDIPSNPTRMIIMTNACLIHCAQGVSRSAAVVAAWLLYSKEASTTQQALHIIREVRPNVQPNIGLLAALHAIERCHGNIDAAMLRIQQNQTIHSSIDSIQQK